MTILAIVIAGSNGTRLHPLKSEHAKPAPVIAAGCRSVDVAPDNPVDSTALPNCGLTQCKPKARWPIGLRAGHRQTGDA
jgi:ADP-glucose pyrophosphorylase